MKKNKLFSFADWCLLSFLFLTRLVGMYVVPLNDVTEARYAEIARKMIVSNDWITLWHEKGIPFWGKPPLSIWLSALSMELFGVNAFAARLPSFLLSLLVIFLLFLLVKQYKGAREARISVLVLASSFLMYLISGTMMMDPALLFAVFLAEASFWLAIEKHSIFAAYMFYLALAIGLLVKGLLIIVLLGGSLGLWVIWHKKWQALWTRLPWFSGTLLMLALALPWYILAERKTPGFINYFIVGEHFARFMHSGWQGDKYGRAHNQIFGIIWLYFLIGAAPWSIYLVKFKQNIRVSLQYAHDTWVTYWFLCCIFPLVFFTFASNLIFPYAAPALPAFAILFAEVLQRHYAKEAENTRLLVLASLVGVISSLAVSLFYFNPAIIAKAENRVVALWQKQSDHTQNPLMYWRNSVAFSAEFYSDWHVEAALDLATACKKVDATHSVYWVVASKDLPAFKKIFSPNIQEIGKIKVKKSSENLLKVTRLPCGEKK